MMKKRPPSQRYKSTRKTIKEKKGTVYIALHLNNSNTVNNRNCVKNQPKLHCKKIKPPLPLPRVKKPKCSRPCHGCVPRRGELVINGGFEYQPDPLWGWIINSAVSAIRPQYGDFPHQGYNAVSLGSINTFGTIYQDVPGICPGMFYQLSFFLSAAAKCGNNNVYIMMEFLDRYKNPLNCPVLEIFVPQNSLINESYTFFCNSTQQPSPPQSRFARIRFCIERAEHPGGFVHLDDVSLLAI